GGGGGWRGGRYEFYVGKQQVVEEALMALERGRARVYPGWKVSAAAFAISLMPMALLRVILSSRPRRQKLLE
ncbi:MAG: hypothetical protein AAGC74_11530, partial [Verrucomicrobiota bacterium]